MGKFALTPSTSMITTVSIYFTALLINNQRRYPGEVGMSDKTEMLVLKKRTYDFLGALGRHWGYGGAREMLDELVNCNDLVMASVWYQGDGFVLRGPMMDHMLEREFGPLDEEDDDENLAWLHA